MTEISKGEKGGECFRTGCSNFPAYFASTKLSAFYCERCAGELTKNISIAFADETPNLFNLPRLGELIDDLKTC